MILVKKLLFACILGCTSKFKLISRRSGPNVQVWLKIVGHVWSLLITIGIASVFSRVILKSVSDSGLPAWYIWVRSVPLSGIVQ